MREEVGRVGERAGVLRERGGQEPLGEFHRPGVGGLACLGGFAGLGAAISGLVAKFLDYLGRVAAVVAGADSGRHRRFPRRAPLGQGTGCVST